MSDSNWPGLGFNPAEGDLHTVQSLAYDVKTVGDELGELHSLLTRIGKTDGIWEGEAAAKFTGKLGELPEYLKQGQESMHACSQALRTWQTRLADHQSRAKGLEADAVEARHRLDQRNADIRRVNAKVESANSNPQLTEAEAKQLNSEVQSTQSAVDGAVDQLQRIIDDAEKLQREWQDRSEEAERAIREAAKNRPPDISFWDKITGGLSKAWDGFKDFLVDNADLFSTLSSALAAAALAANIVPVFGQAAAAVLGAGSVVLAGAAMAGHWMGRTRGNGTPAWKIGLDALGLIPGGGGIGKGVFSGVKALRNGGRLAEGIVPGAKMMMQQLGRPFSTNMITKGLGLFGKTVDDPRLITMGVKSFSAGFGAGHLLGEHLFGGNESGDSGAAAQSNVRTMPYPATSDKFLQTLAA